MKNKRRLRGIEQIEGDGERDGGGTSARENEIKVMDENSEAIALKNEREETDRG